MIHVRRAAERGRSQFAWLDSRHSFSFGHYYDPAHMGVSVLRVLNDDRVAPGAGFGAHSHRDMEIISYVLEGAIAHRDSTGEEATLAPGEVQLMRAGSGITHSEFNAAQQAPLHFLQIWIVPARTGLTPGYQQRRFFAEGELGLKRVIGPDGHDNTLQIAQDVSLHIARLQAGQRVELPLPTGRTGYLHVARGDVELGAGSLGEGDGAVLMNEAAAKLKAMAGAEVLFFDLP
jgi:redox-sensitive bicupin YhaK (pirin superfamily)